MSLYNNSDNDQQLKTNSYIRQKQIKWLAIIVVVLIAIIFYLIVENNHKNQLIEDYHSSNTSLTAYYVASAHSDILIALDRNDDFRMEFIASAQRNLEAASKNMRTYNAWFNFYGDHANTIIGNGSTSQFFKFYIYTLKEWTLIHHTTDQMVDEQTLLLFSKDLEAMDQLFQGYSDIDYETSTPSKLSYNAYQEAFLKLLKEAKTDFYYESLHFNF